MTDVVDVAADLAAAQRFDQVAVRVLVVVVALVVAALVFGPKLLS